MKPFQFNNLEVRLAKTKQDIDVCIVLETDHMTKIYKSHFVDKSLDGKEPTNSFNVAAE